jgi:alginate O-acetyltransferase complex protein AlgJ
VFLRTDTHWTPEGAEVAANPGQAIADKFPLSGEPQTFVTEAGRKHAHKGDLRLFLPLDPLFENLMPAQEPAEAQHRAGRAEAKPVTTRCSPTAVPVALIGTSYSANPNWNFVGALQQALRSDVVNYAEDGHGPILPMLSYLQSDAFKNSPPQVLIWEFPNVICL